MASMSRTTNAATLFDNARAPITKIIDATPPDAWENPSPCEGWAARDVVTHLIDSQRDFLERQDLTLPEPSATDIVDRWHEHTDALVDLLDDPEIADRSYDGYFGKTTISYTIENFFVTDLIAHRWDLARAVGADDSISDDELDQLEAGFEVYGDAAYSPGVFAPSLDAPPDADRQTKVLARMGRRAQPLTRTT
jgi:uncharacterized protein (TIGR03086 family)